MKKYRPLTDEEIKFKYEEARKRMLTSFSYAVEYKKKKQLEINQQYEADMKKYETEHQRWKKSYVTQEKIWNDQQERQKVNHESMYNSKLQYWEVQKANALQNGKPFDESTRPVKTEYIKKPFNFWMKEPIRPVKHDLGDVDLNGCGWILMSFSVLFPYVNTGIPDLNKIRYSSGLDRYGFVSASHNAFWNMNMPNYDLTMFYEKEMKKERVITPANRKKIEYLTIREHYTRLRELECCTLREANSIEPIISGQYGEKLTLFELELMKMKNYKGKILYDLYVPMPGGKSAQIDMLFVSSKGILVIESKNYSGKISGRENDEKWNCEYFSENPFDFAVPTGKRREINNPVRQNAVHINALKQHIKDVPYFSLIVFSERCELGNISVSANTAYIFKRYAMLNAFSKIYNSNPDIFSDEMINYISKQLSVFCDSPDDDSLKKRNSENIFDSMSSNSDIFDDYNG